jgi:hypothetical protein
MNRATRGDEAKRHTAWDVCFTLGAMNLANDHRPAAPLVIQGKAPLADEDLADADLIDEA